MVKYPDRILTKVDKEYIEANKDCTLFELCADLYASKKVVKRYLDKVRKKRDVSGELDEIERRIIGGDISDETIRRRNALLVEIERRTPKKYRKGEGEYICTIHTFDY